jgi:branched-chain amino acid transport system substrate-binding protein
MYDSGIRFYVPIWRGDTYGDGLKSSTEQAFKRLGGGVDAGVRYNPEVKEFTTETAALADKVRAAISAHGKDRTAVHLIAFEEAVTFFNEAAKQSVLKEIRWYGSDGTALSGGVADDAVSAQFSKDTKFLNTIFAPTRSDIFNRVRDTVKSQVGREPDSYSYTMYDILWVLTQSILMANAYDPVAVKELLPTAAGAYFGASGWTVLNAAGDRKTGDYDIWIIETVGDKNEWKLAAVWSATGDSVTFLPGFEKYQ